MQGDNALLQVITIPPGATTTSPRIVLDGVRGAIFVYTNGGPTGALIGSWAGQSGTDPYGNPYPAGLNVGGSNNSNQPTIYVQATAPTAPIVTNSVWINTTNNSVNTWSGSAWVQQGFNAANLLLNGTITAALLVANIVVAGIVNGTTIQGATFKLLNSFGAVDGIWDSGTDALFIYADLGSASQGAVQASIASKAVNDPVNATAVPQGLFAQQLTLNNQSSAPPSFANGSVFYSSIRGRPRYLSQAGDDSVLDRSFMVVTQFSIGANTIPVQMSAGLNYLANEGSQSSLYEIEIDGVLTLPTGGTGSGPTWTMNMFVDGAQLGGQFTVGATSFPVGGGTCNFTVRERLCILSSGVAGTCLLVAEGSFNRAATNAGNATTNNTSVGSNSAGTTKNFDSTSNHTLAIYGNWSSTPLTGHSGITYLTRLTRRM